MTQIAVVRRSASSSDAKLDHQLEAVRILVDSEIFPFTDYNLVVKTFSFIILKETPLSMKVVIQDSSSILWSDINISLQNEIMQNKFHI